MEIKLPEGTPDNITRAYDESRRILNEVNTTANASSEKYRKGINARKYLGYFLKFTSGIGAILITAGFVPHQIAIAVAVVYTIDTTLSNSKRLVSVAQATKAFITMGLKTARTHQVEQNKIWADEEDNVEAIKKITHLNIRLAEEANSTFETIEAAINKSDIETLQALSLNEDKLNLATQHLKGNK